MIDGPNMHTYIHTYMHQFYAMKDHRYVPFISRSIEFETKIDASMLSRKQWRDYMSSCCFMLEYVLYRWFERVCDLDSGLEDGRLLVVMICGIWPEEDTHTGSSLVSTENVLPAVATNELLKGAGLAEGIFA